MVDLRKQVVLLVSIALVAIIFLAGWVVNGWRLGEQIAALKQSHAEQNTRHSAATLHRYTEMERQKDEAIQVHAQLAIQNKLAADAAKRTVDGLRGDFARVPGRIATASREAVNEYAATVSEVLGACTAEYQYMAEQADGHAADVRLMQDAWPK